MQLGMVLYLIISPSSLRRSTQSPSRRCQTNKIQWMSKPSPPSSKPFFTVAWKMHYVESEVNFPLQGHLSWTQELLHQLARKVWYRAHLVKRFPQHHREDWLTVLSRVRLRHVPWPIWSSWIHQVMKPSFTPKMRNGRQPRAPNQLTWQRNS